MEGDRERLSKTIATEDIVSDIKRGIAVGIDAGGTKTLGILVDENGREIARTQSAGANPWDVGPQAARDALASVLKELLAGGGVKAVCLGSAGVDREEDRVVSESVMRSLVGHDVLVDVRNDAAAALGLAGPKRPAMVVVAGTGSICYGETADGNVQRVGGHGAILGDVGSGSSLGLAALRHTANVYDGTEVKGKLSEFVIGELRLKRAGDIASRILHPNLDMPLVASLAPLVDKAAKAGDPAAKAIITSEGAALAANAKRLARSIRTEASLPCLLIGSIFSAFPEIREAAKEAVKQTGPVVVLESSESVLGAARIALDMIAARAAKT